VGLNLVGIKPGRGTLLGSGLQRTVGSLPARRNPGRRFEQ
jgi:hypothetical protein